MCCDIVEKRPGKNIVFKMTKSINIWKEMRAERKEIHFSSERTHIHVSTGVMYDMAKSIARNHFKLSVDKTWAWLNACRSLKLTSVLLLWRGNFYGGDEDLFLGVRPLTLTSLILLVVYDISLCRSFHCLPRVSVNLHHEVVSSRFRCLVCKLSRISQKL